MKRGKKLLFFVLVVLMGGCMLTSCSDDDAVKEETARPEPLTATTFQIQALANENATLTFTDGTTQSVTFDGEGKLAVTEPDTVHPRTFYSITPSGGSEILLGRKEGGSIILNLSDGKPVFRMATDGRTLIGTYAELALISDDAMALSGQYVQEADLTLLGNSELENKGLVRQNWNPIKDFSGTYDGEGYQISDLYADYPEAENVALFGNIAGKALLSNIALVNCNVSGASNVGGLCGTNQASVISGCYVTSGTIASSGNCAGGICGFNYYGQMKDCYNLDAEVVGKAQYTGGVCAWSYLGTVTSCHNESSRITGKVAVGGVCGSSHEQSSVFSDCYNTGKVTGSDYVGGVLGLNNGSEVSKCYNTGDVTGTGTNVGGIAGRNGGGSGVMEFCYNKGKVSGKTSVGGVSGDVYFGTMTACYNTGDVTGESDYTGGVTGINGVGVMMACYNTGLVSGPQETTGGVCGWNTTSSIVASYWLKRSSLGAQQGVGKESKQPGVTSDDIVNVLEFSSESWPGTGEAPHIQNVKTWAGLGWGLYEGDGKTKPVKTNYWSSYGSWKTSGQDSEYPKLWWEKKG